MEPNSLSERITDLEVKFSFVEEHIHQQDREILALRTKIERQTEELERLRSENAGDGLNISGDEKPPHY